MKVQEVGSRRSYGLYEPKENPKTCPKCNSEVSVIVSFHSRTDSRIRRRQCDLCGKLYQTVSPVFGIAPKSVRNM